MEMSCTPISIQLLSFHEMSGTPPSSIVTCTSDKSKRLT